MQPQRLTIAILAPVFVCLTAVLLSAQPNSETQPAGGIPPGNSADSRIGADPQAVPLPDKQGALSMRYKRFEKTLLQMAEYMRKTDPERADLLIRAISKSKGDRIAQQMEQIVVVLRNKQYGDAIERQAEMVVHLRALLELLQSQDRKKWLEEEKARIQDILKDLNRIYHKQRDNQAGTQRGENTGDLARKQQKIAADAKRLRDKIDQQDAQRNAQPGEGKPSEGKTGEGKPGEGKPDKEKSGDEKPDEGKPGEGKPGEGKPGEGKSGEGKPGDSGQQNKTPGRDEIERARQEMERAIEELKKQQRDAASGHEDAAIAELIKAKEKLEEILRQLREEERQLLLAALEARFQKMLALQLIVYNGTVSLGKTPKKDWQARHAGRARELSVQEDEIALDAAKALTLLKEDGSSVAFPEAVEQLREDMLAVARRLERELVADLTQSIELDIIEVLQEVIEAFQKEMEKSEEQRQQQQGQQQQQEPQLVEKLAELKMLRSLQLRVNRRTKGLGRLIDGEQATEADVVDQLRQISSRQARIQQATYDLASGRNR